eukprot:c9282_g1_i1.p1 GENE.c9282_g1_i1~~c9282_g1_i1.p1  ORF type:complete len:180 (-),score=21.77 c9282_g1_i1:74-613(-)
MLEQFVLSELEVEQYQVKEILKCLLHTVMFHRALGAFAPEDSDSPLFDLNFVRCSDKLIINTIEEKADAFSKALERSQKGQVVLGFFQKQAKSSWSIYPKEERVYWEQWSFPFTVVPSPVDLNERHRRKLLVEKMLMDRMMFIIRRVNEFQDHVPPVAGDCFPFDISFPQPSESWIWRR